MFMTIILVSKNINFKLQIVKYKILKSFLHIKNYVQLYKFKTWIMSTRYFFVHSCISVINSEAILVNTYLLVDFIKNLICINLFAKDMRIITKFNLQFIVPSMYLRTQIIASQWSWLFVVCTRLIYWLDNIRF